MKIIITIIQSGKFQFLHNTFIFSTIKSHLRLSCICALILSSLRDGAMVVDFFSERLGDSGGPLKN